MSTTSTSVTTPGHDLIEVTVTVNGTPRTASVSPRVTLGDFLRDSMAIKSVHYGCQYGVCGACNVLLDGESVRACLMFAVEADGRSVETVESLSADPRDLHPIQQAFTEEHGLQCGFCTPAMILRTKELIAEGRELSDAEIREALSGTLCRCTGYQYIVAAIRRAQAEAGGDGGPSVSAGGPSTGDEFAAETDRED